MRRNLLLSYLATQFKWLPYSYEYIYHSLVPSELPTFNIWDEEFILGYWNYTNGNLVSSSTELCGKNFYKVEPNTTYFLENPTTSGTSSIVYFDVNKSPLSQRDFVRKSTFTTPNNCYWIKINCGDQYGTTYNHDICINKSNAQLNGHYAPYSPRKVLDKSRILKISGNSEVRNQLVINGDFSNGSTKWNTSNSSLSVSGGIATFTATAQGGGINQTTISVGNGDKILVQCEIKTATATTSIQVDVRNNQKNIQATTNWQKIEMFVDASPSASGYIFFEIKDYRSSGWDSVQVRNISITNLSQAYPFNTPTSITDPRVQNIIAQGYLPKNDGEIKNSVISEIEGGGVNIVDYDSRVLEHGINPSGQVVPYSNFYAISGIKALPNTTYSHNLAGTSQPFVFYYHDDTFISSQDLRNTGYTEHFTTPNNCNIIAFQISNSVTQPMVNRGNTLISYKPFLPQQYLPSEYQEVEYLESHGTEYIDTGFKPNQNTKTILKCNIVELPNSDNALFDSRDTGSNNRYGLFLTYGGDNQFNTYDFNYSDRVPQQFNTNGVFNVEFSNKLVVNGTIIYDKGSQTFTCQNNLFFFAGNNNGTPNWYSKYKMLASKIYDNGTLIRNFIPCYRKTDNVAGLYDLVNNVFYTNQGTGTFSVGKKVNRNTIIKLPAPLELSGVNTAENTFEVTENGYVFTRNVFDVDLGGLYWTYNSDRKLFYTGQLPNSVTISSNADTFNGLCAKYQATSMNNARYDITPTSDKVMCCGYITNLSQLAIRDDSFNGDTSAFTIAMTGVPLEYQLATPQTITIPRKHLGAVKLKDLSWTIDGSHFYASVSNIKPSVPNEANIYCNKYLKNYTAYVGGMPNMCISTHSTRTDVFVRDDRYTGNLTDFVNSLTDTDILFYETQNETTDFVNEEVVESGGEVNGQCVRVPIEYQEVEYIESTGNQWIDSGMVGNENTSFRIKAKASNTNLMNLIGSRSGSMSNNISSAVASVGFVADFGNYLDTRLITNVGTDVFEVYNSKSYRKVNDVSATTSYSGTFTTPANIYIFDISVDAPATNKWIGRIYYCQIYDNNTLVRNFIPVYRKIDSVIGLYDTIEGKFYTNAGTGTFLKGGNVNAPTCEVLPNVEMLLKCK